MFSQIWAESYPYFYVLGQDLDSVQILENRDTILPTYGENTIRESKYFGIFHAMREQQLDAN